MTNKDWYAVLGLEPIAATDEVARAVERLGRQAAAMANTAPERSQHLRETIRGIKRDLLASDEQRRRYDAGLEAPAPTAVAPAPGRAARSTPAPASDPGLNRTGASPATRRTGRFLQFLKTGWTCPACGEGALPSDKFCPRCGAAMSPPSGAPADTAGRPRRPDACAQCNAIVPRGGHFCGACGAAQA